MDKEDRHIDSSLTVDVVTTTIRVSVGTPMECNLSATLWLPKEKEVGERKYPSVLEYIPYRKSDGTAYRDSKRHPYYAHHGIVSIRVDLRGSGDSEGVLVDEYLPQELQDACDVIAWMASQPWSNGSVGMFGKSWGGFNALQVAFLAPPALKSIISVSATVDRYAEDVHYIGGCVQAFGMLSWAAVMLGYNAAPPDPVVVPDWFNLWCTRLKGTPPYVHEWLKHPNRDSYWKHGSVCEDYTKIQIPVLAIGGYADGYTSFVPDLIRGLGEGQCWGLLGPWAHQYPEEGSPGPRVNFGEVALRWWKETLNNKDRSATTNLLPFPPLQTFVHSLTLSDRPTRAYPSPSFQGSWLSLSRDAVLHPPSNRTLRFVHDLKVSPWCVVTSSDGNGGDVVVKPDASVGLQMGSWWGFGQDGEGPADQHPDDFRSASFTMGTPLKEDIKIVGYPVVEVCVSVDQPTAFIAVRLCAVNSVTNESTLLSYGVLSLNRRLSMEFPTPVTPHEKMDCSVRLRYTSVNVSAGHSLRVSISQDWWPIVWPSPTPVTLTVHSSVSGCLHLPVVPDH
eukprot:PhF_6_TR26133/c0_g1_i1/m.37000/K06978/K06978; uncharacterized protein